MEALKKGIDVSHWQGSIDFAAVKSAGFDFVIIKAGGADAGYYKDSQFERYYADAVAAGLDVGAYYFTGKAFCTAAQGKIEAQQFLNIVRGKKFSYPLEADIEAVPTSAGRSAITDAAVAFLSTLEQAGYYAGVYASDISGFKERLDDSRLAAYDHWVARYTANGPQYVKEYGLWQYGGSINKLRSVKVAGVSSAACDQNYAYKDYPAIIKAAGLNGYTKEAPEPAKKSNEEIAAEVLTGSWGNGSERKQRLAAAGYDYAAIQSIVNGLASSVSKKSDEEVAREVVQGLWGNGATRREQLAAAGYDYAAVQRIVNELT
jgi:hypothetical protein